MAKARRRSVTEYEQRLHEHDISFNGTIQSDLECLLFCCLLAPLTYTLLTLFVNE